MLLAAIMVHQGRPEERDKLIAKVERLQGGRECQGQHRILIRCKLLLGRPEDPCVGTLALMEDLYRYGLLHELQDTKPLKAGLAAVAELAEVMTSSRGSMELDLAANLWLGVLARLEEDFAGAAAFFEYVIITAMDASPDLVSFPCRYHLYVVWTELTCVRIQEGKWVAARRCRKEAIRAMHAEVARVGKEHLNGFNGNHLKFTRSESLLNDAEGLVQQLLGRLLVSAVHPLHPRCPIYFWQVQNVLVAAGEEIAARTPEVDPNGLEADYWGDDCAEGDDVLYRWDEDSPCSNMQATSTTSV